ncbi:MAG: FHA domain-containing protein [Candidatus Binataceae bacterium]
MNLGSINRRELYFKGLAGLAGGAAGWLPVELASHNQSLTDPVTPAVVIASYVSMALLSGMVGGLIVASEVQKLQITPDTKRRFLRGFVICLVLAIPANYFANSIFSAILGSGGWGLNKEGSAFFLIVGRVVSWTMMGAMLGAGVGLATFAAANIAKGAAGGLVGGFIGGVAFDLINYITEGGTASRLIGLCAIGLAIGLFIGIVQELTKVAWLIVEQGRLKGRQFRLEEQTATIGRAEEDSVGLFGDPSVQARHATIQRRGADFSIKNLAVAEGTFVNGRRIESVDLHDRDRINIGGYELVFHMRASAIAAAMAYDRPSDTHVARRLTGRAGAVAGPRLETREGESHPLNAGGATSMGRALDNDVVVSDGSVSRHHASVEAENGKFVIRDLNSQNGTFVQDQRVNESPLQEGDSVRLGDAPFVFRA